MKKLKRVHFVGIGGVGVSAVARLLHLSGAEVSGSDISISPITEKLEDFGIKVHQGHNAAQLPAHADLVIHTIAVREDNPEISEAFGRGIQTATYPQMLSIISKNMTTIAVSGTHGKTTTTGMLAKVLKDAALDPTVIIGSLMKDSDSNLLVGKSQYFVVEACEYRRSFLNLYPKILIITNIDTDHLDYYKDLADIQSAFRELALRIPEDGAIICNTSHPNLLPILEGLSCKIIDYTLYIKEQTILKVPGKHNRENAAAVLAVADFLNVPLATAMASLSEFTGTWRRFDLRGQTPAGATLYDDYAHHPQEIMATLSGMKEMYPDKKRVAFFQPHLFSRTKLLLEEFSHAFGDADEIYLLPIYAAREGLDESINSHMLIEKIKASGKNAFHVETLEDAKNHLATFDANTVVAIMGAGNIYKLTELALEK